MEKFYFFLSLNRQKKMKKITMQNIFPTKITVVNTMEIQIKLSVTRNIFQLIYNTFT